MTPRQFCTDSDGIRVEACPFHRGRWKSREAASVAALCLHLGCWDGGNVQADSHDELGGGIDRQHWELRVGDELVS